MRKVLITGLGFIGRHVAKELLDRGCEVSVLERKPGLKTMIALGLNPIVGDIRDAELMRDITSYYDGVVNLAGLLGTSEMIDDPIPAVNTNIIGAINVFEGCRRVAKGGSGIRCVQITVGNHFMDNPYSITKSTSERFAKMYNTEHGTDIRVVRVLNGYGPYQKHFPVRKIVPNFIRSALQNEPIKIYGDGEQIMDMIYVEDVAKVLVEALFIESLTTIISAGTGRRSTVNEIAEAVVSIAQSTSELHHVAMRPGEPEHSVVLGEPESLRSVGIEPSSLTDLEQGLNKTIAWYKQNRSFIGLEPSVGEL
jgi:nucleoside-diphosphate-sugar epimerase